MHYGSEDTTAVTFRNLQAQHQIFVKGIGNLPMQEHIYKTLSKLKHNRRSIKTSYMRDRGIKKSGQCTDRAHDWKSIICRTLVILAATCIEKLEMGTVASVSCVIWGKFGSIETRFSFSGHRPSNEDFRKSSSSGNSCRLLDLCKNSIAASSKSSKLPNLMRSAR